MRKTKIKEDLIRNDKIYLNIDNDVIWNFVNSV